MLRPWSKLSPSRDTERVRLAPARVARVARCILVNVCVLLLLFILAEGLNSVILLSTDMLGEDVAPERAHTRYDPELGWAPVPNLDIPNMYGPGEFLRTNSQGFRGTREYTEGVPPGKRRIICSGDSVTFGYGVDDANAWCSLLETIDPRLETINMALPGYGVDQAYLLYKREAGGFDHHVHLFAPITDDFRRMQATRFNGYGRPFLVVQGDRLEVTNTPVPSREFRLPWLTEARHHLWSLRSAETLRRLRRLAQDFSGSATAAPVVPASLGRKESKAAAENEAVAVVSRMLQDLKAMNAARGSHLVVVYLPTLNDRGRDTAFWIDILGAECAKLDIPFVNLVADFDRLPQGTVSRLYLPDLGHYNRDGNQLVAELVYQRLAEIPRVSRAMFGGDGPRRTAFAGPPTTSARR